MSTTPRSVSAGAHPHRLQFGGKGAEKERNVGSIAKGGRQVILLRQEIGDVLRDTRLEQRRTLREVSTMARVSLGYLSEVERGQKEASSELLASICRALDMKLSSVLREVSQRVAVAEGPVVPHLGVSDMHVPDTVPDDLADGVSLVGAV